MGSPPADAHPGEVSDKWLRLARHLAGSGEAGEFAASLRKVDVVRDCLEVADLVVCQEIATVAAPRPAGRVLMRVARRKLERA